MDGIGHRVIDIDPFHMDHEFIANLLKPDLGLAEDGEGLAAGGVFEQVAHVNIGLNVGRVTANPGIGIFRDDGLGRVVDGEAGQDQVVVTTPAGRV